MTHAAKVPSAMQGRGVAVRRPCTVSIDFGSRTACVILEGISRRMKPRVVFFFIWSCREVTPCAVERARLSHVDLDEIFSWTQAFGVTSPVRVEKIESEEGHHRERGDSLFCWLRYVD